MKEEDNKTLQKTLLRTYWWGFFLLLAAEKVTKNGAPLCSIFKAKIYTFITSLVATNYVDKG